MIKRILIITATILVAFFTTYFLNKKYVTTTNQLFSLSSIYTYQAIATFLVYVIVELVMKKLPNETGYLFLALSMIQLGVFILLFQNTIFSEQPLTKADKASIIIPFFTSLIIEVTSVVKLLNNQEFNPKKAS